MNQLSFKISNDKLSYIIFIFFGSLLSLLSILKYNSLHSTIFDLGVFIWNISNSIHEPGRIFFGHAQPLLLAYSSIYNLLPTGSGPYFLLALQAFTLASPLPLLLRFFGPISTLAYILYFGVWYNSLFDFHLDHIAIPLLFLFFFYHEKEDYLKATLIAGSLIFIKEPFALQTAACGIFLIFKKRLYNYGIVLIVFGFGYFLFSTNILIPYFSQGIPGGLGSSAFSWLGNSIWEMLIFISTNPIDIISEIFSTPNKRSYLFHIFGAVGFICLLRPSPLIVALPIIAIALLAEDSNYSGFRFHYTAGLIAPLIVSFHQGLPALKHLSVKLNISYKILKITIFLILLSGHIFISPSPISTAFWNNKSWGYNYNAYNVTSRDKLIIKAIHKHIPNDRHILISAQNTLNIEWLANRKYFTVFPKGVFQPVDFPAWSEFSLESFINSVKTNQNQILTNHPVWADYIVLDLKRPWYLLDKGCYWYDGKCQNNKSLADLFLQKVAEAKRIFTVIYQKDGFFILKRTTI